MYWLPCHFVAYELHTFDILLDPCVRQNQEMTLSNDVQDMSIEEGGFWKEKMQLPRSSAEQLCIKFQVECIPLIDEMLPGSKGCFH